MYNHLFILIFISIFIYGLLYYITKKHKNFKKRKLDTNYYITSYINCIISIFIVMCALNYHTFCEFSFPKLSSILTYFIITDTIYYWVHIIIHRTPFLKKNIHSTHHEAIKLIPLDVFYIDYKDNILYVLIVTVMPLLYMNVNIIEYLIVILTSLIHVIYTHSESKNKFVVPLFTDSKYHKYHHQIGGGNYSIFFSIWDDYMGTKIKPKGKI